MANFTKDAIKATFLKLLEEKPLSQITVKNIVETCGINRNTFYYHYQDLPQLIEEIVMDEADRIMKEYPDVDSMKTALNVVFRFVNDNRRAIMHIYNSVNREIFENYLWKLCDNVIQTYTKNSIRGRHPRPQDVELMERYYRCVCFGMAIDWLNNKMQLSPQEEIERFFNLNEGLMEMMIARSEQGNL